ncbi:MAG: tryptophan synthase subunit beta [Bacteroidota bacterium]|nr:tryptophan synthase subunit beta [Bacteroidota bacterium]
MRALNIINEKGYYGEYGGAYIPELLFNNVDDLERNYLKIIQSQEFQKEYHDLLENYVGRPTPLYLANNLSEQFKAKIYLKREDLCHTGAHKINNTIGQILVAKALGKKRILAETGAGQHGVATATVCALLKLECIVYMGEIDMQRQEANVARIKMLGATIIPAISGSKTLKDATNEAIRGWINDPDSYYLIGSVVGPHPYPDMVSRFQSVISKEIKQQLLKAEGISEPDMVIACVGGGSNAAGAFYEFINSEKTKLIGVEAAGKGIETGKSAATMTLGTKGILHGSQSIIMQTKDGQIVEPYSISAGLDYPGIGPLHAFLGKSKRASYLNATDEEALEAAFNLTLQEGIIPALESAHALAILNKLEFKKDQVIIVNLSGRGDKDLPTYLQNMNRYEK